MVTGDVGRLDSDGLLFVVGRDDDMIVSGGENVYPIEVEKALGEHDAVREVVVVGVPDENFGQRLAAYVVRARRGRRRTTLQRPRASSSWPATRCPATWCSSTSCPATRRAR